MNLFTYGTLMFPEVWKRINIGEFASQPATLYEFAIYRIRDAVFPGLVRGSASDQVRGLVYFDLDEETLFEIDTYESNLYERVPVAVTLDNGSQLSCETYRVLDSCRDVITEEPWDASRFEQEELEKYLQGS